MSAAMDWKMSKLFDPMRAQTADLIANTRDEGERKMFCLLYVKFPSTHRKIAEVVSIMWSIFDIKKVDNRDRIREAFNDGMVKAIDWYTDTMEEIESRPT